MVNISDAQKLVVNAGTRLVESGLIARTWGNVSCRLDADHFVITPSGRDYMTLKPAEIVSVKISDGSYQGSIKPSSEKGIHAEVYKLRPDANFVIHTHQEQASIISAAAVDKIQVQGLHPELGSEVWVAPYALPGTGKLRRHVSRTLSCSNGQAVIMKNHGALCFGIDQHQAFQVASELEEACRHFIIDRYLYCSGREVFDYRALIDFALSSSTKNQGCKTSSPPKSFLNSRRTPQGFALYDDTVQTTEFISGHLDGTAPEEAHLYDAVFRKYKNIDHIYFKSTPEILALSKMGIDLSPLLDDFAQIGGPVARTVESDPKHVLAALKRSSVVFIRNGGALCCGATLDDALAVGLVTQKACLAYIGALLFGPIHPINPLECLLMRLVYQKTYSKQKA